MILTIKTDNPQAEISLHESDGQLLKAENWQAHHELAKTIHHQIAKKLQLLDYKWDSITGIIVFKGPGSFTGLRIGVAVANALAYGLNVPVVGTSGQGWRQKGFEALAKQNQFDKSALPGYEGPAKTTKPRE